MIQQPCPNSDFSFNSYRNTTPHLAKPQTAPPQSIAVIMATEDERYRMSTQFRLWSYSPGQLAELRAKTNSLAKQNISERLSSFSSSSMPVSTTASANPSGSNTPNPSAGASTAPADVPSDLALSSSASSLPEFLTPAEEEQLLGYYTVQTLRAAEFCHLPTEIRATAAVFLRRFYLTHSVMTYPPAKMMKTCVFFGAKAENFYPRVDKIAEKFPNTSGDEILAGEFLLCQGIRFAFDVRHPYRALEGAIMQLRLFDDVDVGPPPLGSASPLSMMLTTAGTRRTTESRRHTFEHARSSSSAPSSPTPTSTTPRARSCWPPCP